MRIRVELPDVRTAIAEQDRLDKPALIIMDGNGVGLGIYQDLRKTMDHLAATKSLEESASPLRKQQNFNNTILALYDGLIRIPEHMPGLETLLYELATFPDGKFDDQVDALSLIGQMLERLVPGQPDDPEPEIVDWLARSVRKSVSSVWS